MRKDYWNIVIHVLCDLPLKRHHPSTARGNQKPTGTELEMLYSPACKVLALKGLG